MQACRGPRRDMSFFNDNRLICVHESRCFKGILRVSNLLSGMKILVLEDEVLIAMDVEQLCRDNGAADVVVARNLADIDPDRTALEFHAAIVDVMLDGTSTLDFARRIRERNLPFVFASGYTDLDEIFTAFPGIAIVGKPYSGSDLVEAVAAAAGRRP
jgi:DNA-binding response OmpR family regulator